jgi:hypothetical protein
VGPELRQIAEDMLVDTPVDCKMDGENGAYVIALRSGAMRRVRIDSGGLNYEHIGETLSILARTAKRGWIMSRAWRYVDLTTRLDSLS